ncbi:MAG: 4-(cytidine 5'-diphospho)-2-C-methyl-D-erythritol kinase [Jatrophihabitantaceae bacterium]
MPVTESQTRVRVRVPAKVNLHLGVGDLRPDGFHELVTVFHAVDVYDEVRAHPAVGLQLEMSGEGADDLPRGPDNVAWQAASRLAELAQVAPDVRLDIAKSIPVAAGMAGGSADAAGTLLACATLWHTGSSKAALADMAAELGSDIPFPLMGGTALGTGRGEQLSPVLTTGSLDWVFAFADFGISAADAYRELDRLRSCGTAPDPAGPPDELLDALRVADTGRVAAALVNDLQPASLSIAPDLQRTLDTGLELGALAAIISGSGPTCAFLCTDPDSAVQLALELSASNTCHNARAGRGPVHGARIVV